MVWFDNSSAIVHIQTGMMLGLVWAGVVGYVFMGLRCESFIEELILLDLAHYIISLAFPSLVLWVSLRYWLKDPALNQLLVENIRISMTIQTSMVC